MLLSKHQYKNLLDDFENIFVENKISFKVRIYYELLIAKFERLIRKLEFIHEKMKKKTMFNIIIICNIIMPYVR